MDQKFKLLSQYLGEERIKLDEDLKFHTHTKINIKSGCFFVATNQKEFIKILDLAFELQIPFFVLGAGTKFLNSDLLTTSLVIKNRTSAIKFAGIKGKVGVSGLGIQEALVEVDSGVSINKLNEYLLSQGLESITGYSSLLSTVGGSLFVDLILREKVQNIKIWSDTIVSDIPLEQLKRNKDIIISATFRFKAKKVKEG